MSLNSHSHRFDRMAVPGDRDGRGRAVRGAGRVPLLRGREATNDPTRRDCDEVLEQIASEGAGCPW